MRLIITGGTGLIGRALATDLLADGHEVIALSRSPQRAKGTPAGLRLVRWDAHSAEGWAHLAEGADAIVNLAGASLAQPWTAEHRSRIRQSRLNAGRAIVEAVRSCCVKPGLVVQASGTGYYGAHADEEITEDHPSGSDFLASVAGEWEASTADVQEEGVRQAVIRTGVVLSLSGGAFPLMVLPFRFFVGGPLGSGRQWLPWIHLQDEVSAIRFLIEDQAANGPYNLVAPEPLTNAAFSRLLGQVMKRPSYIRVPAGALQLFLGDMSSLVLEGQRALPRRLQQQGFAFRFPDALSALRNVLSP